MSAKEKLESLAKNSIELKIDGKEQYKLDATRFGGQPDVPLYFYIPKEDLLVHRFDRVWLMLQCY